jgi:hypothetical protein
MKFNYNYYNAISNYTLYQSFAGIDIPDDLFKKLNLFISSKRIFTYINFFKHKNNTIKVIAAYPDNLFFLYFLDESLEKLHRNKGPAYVEFNKPCEKPFLEKYYKNGIEHRKNKPQQIFYFYCGKIKSETYKQNGKLHSRN